MPPRLTLSDRPVRFRGRRVGKYATDLNTGDIVFVSFNTRMRIWNSFSITTDLVDDLDPVRWIYVFDNDSDDVYRYRFETYDTAPIEWMNDQSQRAPDVSEHEGKWTRDEVLA